MAARAGVDVDVHELRRPAGEGDLEPGLLMRLAQRPVPRRFTRVDVPAGLEPDPERLVLDQDHAARTDDHRRAGDVDRIGILVERSREGVEAIEELGDARPLGVVDRLLDGHALSNAITQRVRVPSPTTGHALHPRQCESIRNRDKSLELRLVTADTNATPDIVRATNQTHAWNPPRNSHPECCWRSTISVCVAPTRQVCARRGSP